MSGNLAAADPVPEAPAEGSNDGTAPGDDAVAGGGVDVPVGVPIGGAPADAGADTEGAPVGVAVATGRLDAAAAGRVLEPVRPTPAQANNPATARTAATAPAASHQGRRWPSVPVVAPAGTASRCAAD